ncbi:hypothetical protein ANN_21111 [Periplaneta americana]|uniref:Mariner Mos1 transposase n=1 Tax=Periplaneta americana TaxID=6978 RepID=A0ABQ8SEG4_PERAM|nr:hypothetical protein ANN_21111 [Periplaneta americana]
MSDDDDDDDDDEDEEGRRGNPVLHVAYSCRIAPRGPPGLTSPSDGRITINKGLLLVDIMPHGTTINSDGYVATLKKLKVRLSLVRRHWEKQDVLLLHDNAQPYVSHKTTDQIRKFG